MGGQITVRQASLAVLALALAVFALALVVGLVAVVTVVVVVISCATVMMMVRAVTIVMVGFLATIMMVMTPQTVKTNVKTWAKLKSEQPNKAAGNCQPFSALSGHSRSVRMSEGFGSPQRK